MFYGISHIYIKVRDQTLTALIGFSMAKTPAKTPKRRRGRQLKRKSSPGLAKHNQEKQASKRVKSYRENDTFANIRANLRGKSGEFLRRNTKRVSAPLCE